MENERLLSCCTVRKHSLKVMEPSKFPMHQPMANEVYQERNIPGVVGTLIWPQEHQ